MVWTMNGRHEADRGTGDMDIWIERIGFVNGKFPATEETRVREFHCSCEDDVIEGSVREGCKFG